MYSINALGFINLKLLKARKRYFDLHPYCQNMMINDNIQSSMKTKTQMEYPLNIKLLSRITINLSEILFILLRNIELPSNFGIYCKILNIVCIDIFIYVNMCKVYMYVSGI